MIGLHSVRSVLTRYYISHDTRGRHHIGDDSRQPRLRKQPVYIAHSSQSVGELEMDLGASVAHIYIWWLDSLICRNEKWHSLGHKCQTIYTCFVPAWAHFITQPSLDRTRCAYGLGSNPLLEIFRSTIREGAPFWERTTPGQKCCHSDIKQTFSFLLAS